MADGTFPGLVSKDRDLNATGNPIYVQLSDGTSALSVTSGSLDVNLTNTSIAVTGSVVVSTASGDSLTVDGTVNIGNTVTVTATDLDIRDLDHSQDSVAVGDGTDILAVNADGSINITDNGGSITVDGAVTVSATDLDIRDLSASQDNVAISDGTDQLAVNTDGSINVVVQNDAQLSDEFHDFNQASAVAGAGTSNHDYTVVNTYARLAAVYVGASGDAKFEIQVDNGGGFNTIAVAFTTGKQGDSKLVEFPVSPEVTTTIRVIRTNRENQAQDLYSTIMGRDIT